MCYETKSSDFAITVGSAKSENITSAQDLMKVKIQAEEIRYSLDKTDIPLSLSWYDTGADVVSEISCESDVAAVNQEVRRIVFTENGEAKVAFFITNAFGTFASNELSLVCEDVVILPQTSSAGCVSSLQLLPMAAVVVLAAVLGIKKMKSSKEGE